MKRGPIGYLLVAIPLLVFALAAALGAAEVARPMAPPPQVHVNVWTSPVPTTPDGSLHAAEDAMVALATREAPTPTDVPATTVATRVTTCEERIAKHQAGQCEWAYAPSPVPTRAPLLCETPDPLADCWYQPEPTGASLPARKP